MNVKLINTLGELKTSGYKSRSIKNEMRENLISFLKKEINTCNFKTGATARNCWLR